MSRQRTKIVEQLARIPGGERQIVAARPVRLLGALVERLPSPTAHGNRKLLFQHVVLAHLLAFFNPCLRGLRSIQELFDQPHVRKRFATPKLPRSTLADAQRVFDPALLLPLIASLVQRVKATVHDRRLDVLTQKLLAVDGTFFTVAHRIVWALFNGGGKGNVRAHVRFDVLKGVPEAAVLTHGRAGESAELLKHLESGCLYLMDRGFQSYALLKAILDTSSDFLVRLRKSAVLRTLEELRRSAADQAAGVVADRIVQLGCGDDQTPALPPLRCVEVVFTTRRGQVETLHLLTSRLDLPAHLIALLYQHRWQVELFFRWLKCVANFEHFFSESLEGMTLQVYVSIIGTLLIALETGVKPSKYDYTMISCVLCGWSDLDEALQAGAKRRAERQRAAEWQRAYNARKADANRA